MHRYLRLTGRVENKFTVVHRCGFPEHEQEILETLTALLAQCDELLHDLEQYDPKYDELIRTTRAAYGNALAAYVAK
ncbi:MAG: hypothetical protein ACREYC_24665 [Gammaproteobacteria bacterium]